MKTPDQQLESIISTQEQKTQDLKSNNVENANERTETNLSPENQGFFSRMSEKGAKIANQVYEGLDKIPGVNRIVGKLEIAHNQFWIDKHQEKSVGLKSKMDGLDLKVGAFDQSKEEIESVIEDLKQQNIPGVESLQLKLQDMERQRTGLLNERDRVQSKFEARDNKIKLYTNERDRVADKLIDHYEERLKPMEAELERLQTYKDQADLLVAVTEAKHKEQLVKLGDIDKKKNQIAESLRGIGMSEKEIRKFKAIKELEGVLADGREKVRIEKENLARRKAEINERIAKVDAKANPYRGKREEFVRVKEGRPIKIDVATRQRDAELKPKEDVKAYPEGETASKESPEDKERLQAAAYVSGWNAFLKETHEDAAEFINAEDFLGETRLTGDYRLDFGDFKNILGKYLNYKKAPMDQFNQNIDKFFEQKVKVKK